MNGEPHILHALRGRVRIALPAWSGQGQRQLERLVHQAPGVRHVAANPLTASALVTFDPGATNHRAVLDAVRRAASRTEASPEPDRPTPPVVEEKARGRRRRARIAVRGLDRHPHRARQAVERLRSLPGVTAHASSLTSRILVEYDEHLTDIEDLLAEISDLDLPDLPDEDWPSHPLDPAPLAHGVTRTVGAALGLSWLAMRRLAGLSGNLVAVETAATAAGVIGLLRGFPVFRNGLRRLMGKHTADLVFGAASIATLTFAGSPLGLAVTGVEGALLLREVLRRRAAWHRYESRLSDKATSEPGAVIRVRAGRRVPRAAEVIEGTGSAVGRDGLPLQLAPGDHVPAGARVAGGPFVLQLQPGRPFTPQPRPAPLAPTLYTRYIQLLGPASLGYAALMALFTRSVARTFEALLLVNPRPAVIGMETANLDAADRVLRAGATVVGTRHRAVCRPGVLLLDGPRVLAQGVEITCVVPLGEHRDAARLLALAGGVAAAAGFPWGAFPGHARAPASRGHFDGRQATAEVEGVPYVLGPPGHGHPAPEAASLRQPGVFVLALRQRDEERPRGLLALRPRLSPGLADLRETCHRHGVRLALIPAGDHATARAVAVRAGVRLLHVPDAVHAVRAHQRDGSFVALVSDSADAAEAFEACDLAIGISSGMSGRFPARADLLVPDFDGVAAVVEAGALRDLAVRDAVVVSAVSNVVGAAWGFGGGPGIERAMDAGFVTALAALADGWFRLAGGARAIPAPAPALAPAPRLVPAT